MDNIRLITIAELLFVVIGLIGVAAIFWPAALILAGILGVVACERSVQKRAEQREVEKQQLRQVA